MEGSSTSSASRIQVVEGLRLQNDGRNGQLMSIVDVVNLVIYMINFNTGKYSTDGFFPYVSIMFEIRRVSEIGTFSCSSAAVTFLILDIPWKLDLCVV